jgi:prophage regulatory protein
VKPVFLDLKKTAEYVALSARQIQRLSASGCFPKPRQLSGQRVAWLVRELDEWAESRPVSSILPVGKGED